MDGNERVGAHRAEKARLAAERQALLQKRADLSKRKAVSSGVQVGTAGNPSRQVRDQLVSRLQESQAESAARLEALKQARDKGKEPVQGDFKSVSSPATSQAQSANNAQPLSSSNADFQPAGDGNLQPAFHLRRLTKPASQAVPQSKATFSLPFVEQDDNFEEFAKSLHRSHSDREEDLGSHSLPGQPLSYPTAPRPAGSFSWDPTPLTEPAMQQRTALMPPSNYRPAPAHRPQRLPQHSQPGGFLGPEGPSAFAPEQMQPATPPFGTGMQYSDVQQTVQPRVYNQQGMAAQYPDGQRLYNQQGGLQQAVESQWYDQQQQLQQQQQQSTGQGAYGQQGLRPAPQANSLSVPLASQLKALGDMLNKQTGGRTMAAGMQRTQAGPITAQPGLTGPSQQPSVMPDVSRRPSVAPNLLVSTQAVFSPEEEELRSLQDAHVKKMTRLNYELEQVRTEAELAEMKDKIRRLQTDMAAPLPRATPTALPHAPEPPPPTFYQTQNLPVQQLGPEQYESPVYQPPVASPSRRPYRPVEPDSEEEQEVQERRRRYRRQPSSSSEESFQSSVKSRRKAKQKSAKVQPESAESSQSSEAEPVRIADVESYKVKDLWLDLDVMSPVDFPGHYSIAVVLYDSLEPVLAAGNTARKVQSDFKELKAGDTEGQIRWKQQLCLSRVRLRSTSTAVLEVHFRALDAVQPLGSDQDRLSNGMGDEVIAWAFTKVLQAGEIITGLQSVPVYKLPIMLAAPRKFSWENAFIDLSMADHNMVAAAAEEAKEAAEAAAAAESVSGITGVKPLLPPKPKPVEDIPGVPTAAWARVNRGVPASDPFQPGEGFMLMVDAARFLPGNVGASKVVGSVWSYERQLLCPPFEALSSLDADALAPVYNCQVVLGTRAEQFNDPTATLLLQVECIERGSQELRCVGYAVIPLFMDPREDAQPRRKNLLDYVLNQGSWQIPLHMIGPSREDPTFHGNSLKDNPRVTCSSLLIRILSMSAARAAMRRKTPSYADRAYDSSLDFPTATERKVYPVVLERSAWPMRTAVKPLLSEPPLKPLPPPLLGSARLQKAPSGSPDVGLVKSPSKEGNSLIRALSGLPKLGRGDKTRSGGLLALLGKGKDNGESEPSTDPLGAREDNELTDPDGGPVALPPAEEPLWLPDAEVTAIMKVRLTRPELWNDVPLDYNRAWPYNKALGFHVAMDGASRLPRNLPVAAVFSLSPPGSFYADLPQVGSVRVTLQYDMGAPLHSPSWLDGYQRFQDVGYDSALSLIIDVRTVIPGSGTTAPVGWTALPLFQKGPGRYVASGHYQLPLFKGLPSRLLLDDLAAAEHVEVVLAKALKAGRMQLVQSNASVYVRLCDTQRMGSIEVAANEGPAENLLYRPSYVQDGSRLDRDLRTIKTGGRTYDNARSKDISADMWLDELNDAILAATGLDQLGLVQAPLDEEDLTQAELLEQQRLLAESARSDTQSLQ